MDFLDPDKKKKHRRNLLLGYILVAIAIAMASMVLLFRTFGYDLDTKTGKVIQNGLIFLDSHPESSTVYLNGQDKGHTSTRLTVPAGQYSVSLRRNDYREWKKTINLEGGSIERLVYPLLVPTNLTAADKQLYSAPPGFATDSPDRHWLVVAQPGSVDKFDVFDMNDPKKESTSISLPAGLLSPSTGLNNIALIEWSTDNRHILVQHNFEGGNEFVIIDRESPGESININKTLNSNPARVALRDKKYDQLYLYAPDGTLTRGDLKSKQVTAYLTKVGNFKPYGNNVVLYTTEVDAPAGKVNVDVRDGDKNYVLRTLPAGSEYLLDLAEFDSSFFIAVGAKNEGKVYIYKDALNSLKQSNSGVLAPATLLRLENPAFISFSQNTRFISVQNGSEFAVYDAEADKRIYYTIDKAVPASQKAEWMDGHRLSINFQDHSVIFDFDSLNQQTLTPSYSGFKPFFDRDYANLYNIAPSVSVSGRAAVTRTSMKVGQQ